MRLPASDPGVAGVAVPFALGFKTFYTGLGVIGAYLAVLLGLSYYVRRRLGAGLWRKAHRATIVVYLLGLVHAVGAGSDASAPWFRWWVILTTPVIGGLFAYRVVASRTRKQARRERVANRPAVPAPG
jgi:sulfoxide reductase heme-binding subunit YedZ